MILYPVRVPQGEDQVGELVPLEFGDKLLVLLVGELAGVVFKDGLSSLPTRCVEEHDRGDILSKRLGDAGYLLGQDPDGDAVVSGAETEIDQLSRATLDIFRRGAVVEYEQGVGARKEEAGHPQPVLDFMLQAHDHIDVRVAVHEALVGLVFFFFLFFFLFNYILLELVFTRNSNSKLYKVHMNNSVLQDILKYIHKLQ